MRPPEVRTVHLLAKPTVTKAANAELDAVVEAFESAGVSVELVRASTAAAAERAAKDCVAAGSERLIAAGGDGVVHLAVQAVAGSEVALGIVPMGTGNDFAGAMNLDFDVSRAVERALGPARPVDLMRVGERWAASIATVGFAADVNERANNMRWPRGPQRYTVATIAALPGLTAEPYDVELDGEPMRLDAVLVTVANTSDFGGGMRISPGADPNDGILDLTVVGTAGRIELLRFFRNVYDGSHLQHRKVTTLRARQVRLCTPGITVWADGEPVATSPVDISAVPGALRLAY